MRQNQRIKMWYTVRQMWEKGFNKSQISRELGIDRGTVRKYISMEESMYSDHIQRLNRMPKKLKKYYRYVENLLEAHPYLSAAQVEDRLKAEFGPREAQLKEKRQEIIALEEQIKTDKSSGGTSRRKLEREIRLKVSQLKFLEQEFREDQNLRRNESIRELQQIIAGVLEKLGDSGQYDLILTEGVSYVSGQIDITEQIVEMLKQLPESAEDSQ